MSRDWSPLQFALTGATGFIGYHVSRALRQAGASVRAVVRASSDTSLLQQLGVERVVASLDDPASLRAAFAGCHRVFHLAGAVDFNNDWDLCRQVNVQGTRHVLDAAHAAGVQRLIHASSIVAVGATREPRELHEESIWQIGHLQVPYVTTKREGELAARGFAGSMEVVVVNPASVIGPEDYLGSEFGIFCRRFWKKRMPFVFGGGNNYVDVRDLAEGFLLAAERGRDRERYILGGHNRNFQDLFAEMALVADRAIPRLRLPSGLARFGAAIGDRFSRKRKKRPLLTSAQARLLGWYFYYDISKAQRELGFQPRPFLESLRDTYAFWKTR